MKKDDYWNGEILTHLSMQLMMNALFLFTFKIDTDLPVVNNITISKLMGSKMHHFD